MTVDGGEVGARSRRTHSRSEAIPEAAQTARRSGRVPAVTASDSSDAGWRSIGDAVGPAAALLSIVLLLVALSERIDPNTLGASGSAPALPWTFWAACVLAVVGAVAEISGRERTLILVPLLGVLCAAVYGGTTLIFDVAANPITFVHWGLTDHFAETGTVLENYDSRFSWPGFFAGAAMLVRAVGIEDPTQLLRWSPLIFGVTATVAVFVLARVVLRRSRAVWWTVFVFVAGNSVNQNYFAPQAFAFVVVLWALAVVLLLDGRETSDRPVERARPDLSRLWVVLLLTIASACLAPAHQLSPLFLVALLAVAVVFRQVRTVWLPVIPAVFVVGWWLTGGSDFFVQHSNMVSDDLGDVSGVVQSAVLDRFVGATERQLLVGLRVLLVGLISSLVVFGVFRLRRRAVSVWPMLLCWSFLPFAMMLVQSYGGEMALRCYLFALPGMALVLGAWWGDVGRETRATRGATRRQQRRTGVREVVAGLVLTLLVAGNVAIRGQDDAFYAYSPLDAEASAHAYEAAVPDGSIAGLVGYFPQRYAEIGTMRQFAFANPCSYWDWSTGCFLEQSPNVIVVTPSMARYGEVMRRLPKGWTEHTVEALVASGAYRISWHEGEAWVLERVFP